MMLLLLAALALQQRDTTARDSLSKFLENFNYRALGPAAYSGRVTAIAVPNTAEPRPKPDVGRRAASRALPGEYVVRLTLGKRKLQQRIVVTELPPDRLGRIR